MRWCSWLRIDASWLQWISSKNYSISSASVALDGISAGKSLSAVTYLYYKWPPTLLHWVLKVQWWSLPEQSTPYPMLLLWTYQQKIDSSFRVNSTYIKILTGVCKGWVTSPSYQKHLSTEISPSCIITDPRSVSQGTWNTHLMFGR